MSKSDKLAAASVLGGPIRGDAPKFLNKYSDEVRSRRKGSQPERSGPPKRTGRLSFRVWRKAHNRPWHLDANNA